MVSQQTSPGDAGAHDAPIILSGDVLQQLRADLGALGQLGAGRVIEDVLCAETSVQDFVHRRLDALRHLEGRLPEATAHKERRGGGVGQRIG